MEGAAPYPVFADSRCAPRGVRYASLWETNSPAKKAVNTMVFHDYYKLLMKVIQETPWLSMETVDI